MNPPSRKRKAQAPAPRGKAPTFDQMYSELRKAFSSQAEMFFHSFITSHSEAAIDDFLPETVEEADAWLDERINVFTDNDDPSPQDMLDGAAAIFMAAFLERLYHHVGLTEDDSNGADNDDDESIEGEVDND